jgi:ubiquinone/menaquinone biosynthesis C-methylase UbiE
MFRWFRKSALDPLGVSMAGAKLGDRVLVIGCGDPMLIAALAAKTGLTGRTCAVDESAERVTEASRVALKEGVLIETATMTPDALGSFDGDTFDLVLVGDRLMPGDLNLQLRNVQHARRVLRAGGRLMAVDRLRGSGLMSGSTPATDSGTETIERLKAGGFAAVRTLAERDGVRYSEAVKPR